MFALDNLLRQAVQDAITVLLPGTALFENVGSKICMWSLERQAIIRWQVYILEQIFISCIKCALLIYTWFPCGLLFHCLCFNPFLHSPPCASELKLQLQSSFEIEDSSPEEHYACPDTPVAVVPDKPMSSLEIQETTPTQENPLAVGPNYPLDLVLNATCPLSEKLRNLRLETVG